MKNALLQVLVMLKFRLKWQSNQAPKFLTGSVLGEMMDSPIVRVANQLVKRTLWVKLETSQPKKPDALTGYS